MAILESQLQTWSNQGAQTGSQNTYNSIKIALEAHNWPSEMNHNVYLQGSYPNATNIYGDSDVDVIVESSNVYYDDRPSDIKKQMGWYEGGYNWTDFRNEVKTALSNYYGSSVILQADKCINVKKGTSNRLDADIVPCCSYKHYRGTTHAASGITFWTQSGLQVINYPKLHLGNGQTKNSSCSARYKSNVRVLKNARNRSQGHNCYPSYFLECLLYNVPSTNYVHSRATTYVNCVEWLQQTANNDQLQYLYCQNGVQQIFGAALHQSNLAEAHKLIDDLVNLWNQWGQ